MHGTNEIIKRRNNIPSVFYDMKNKVKEWAGSHKQAYRALITILICFMAASFAVMARAATPTTQIVGFADRATTNLRTAELLEVSASGFSEDAILTYTYTNNCGKTIQTFRGSDTTTCSGTELSNGQTAVRNDKYFAIEGSSGHSGTVSCVVTDTNPDSRTYNATASCSYSGFLGSDLKKDIEAGVYGIFLNDSVRLRTVYGTGGLTHVECFCVLLKNIKGLTGSIHSIDDENKSESDNLWYEYLDETYSMPWPFSDIEVTDYTITGKTPGLIKLSVDGKAPGCTFHTDNKFSNATTSIYVFTKPSVSSALHTITVSGNTQKGVTYTVAGESIVCKKDGETMVFGTEKPLTPNTHYQVELSQKVNGKTVKVYVGISTTNTCYVTIDTNGIPTRNCSNQIEVTYNTPLQRYADVNAPHASGYDFLGWYNNAEGTGDNYMTTPVVDEYITVYAKWNPKKYNYVAEISLDGTPFEDAQVDLYQNGKLMYSMERYSDADTSVACGYRAMGVPYSVYTRDGDKVYSYDIYINGLPTGQFVEFNGELAEGTAGTDETPHFWATSAYVDLTQDMLPWAGQKVVLERGADSYTMTDLGQVNGKERYRQIFMYKTPTLPEVENYSVFINDKRISDWTDETMTSKNYTDISISYADRANGFTKNYYKAVIDVKKDDEPWRGETTLLLFHDEEGDPKVTLRQNNNVEQVAIWDSSSKTYQAVCDSRYPYELYVEGVATGEDTTVRVYQDNRNIGLDFYTVTFVDAEDRSNNYYTQIIQASVINGRAYKPVAPFKEGKSFLGWYPRREYEDTPEKTADEQAAEEQYFKGGVTRTEPVTAPMVLYARWKLPELLINDYIKCTAVGVLDGTSTAEYYRMANLVIDGYPVADGDTPIMRALVEVDESDTVSILGATVPEVGRSINLTYIKDGETYTYTVKREEETRLGIYFPSGWPEKVAQDFLSEQIVIKPVWEESENNDHFCYVEVFGTTATNN